MREILRELSQRRRTYAASLGSGYLYIGATVLVNIALVPVVLLGLGRTRYGIWLTLLAAAQWISIGVTWLGPGIIKRIGHSLAHNDVPAARAVMKASRVPYGATAFCLVAGAIVLSVVGRASWLGGVLSGETKRALILAAVWAATVVGSQVHINVLTAAQKAYKANAILTAATVLSGVGSVAIVLAGGGLDAMAAVNAISYLGSFVALRVLTSRLLPKGQAEERLHFSVLKGLVREAGPFAFSGLGWLLLSSDILLLAFMYGPQRVAEYGVAYKLIEASLQVVWRVADTMQPYIVEFDSLKNSAALKIAYTRTVTLSVALGGAIGAFMFFQGRTILDVWVGPGNGTDASVIRLLSVYLVIQSFVHSSTIFPFSAARMRSIGKVQLAEGVVKVLVAFVLVKSLGLRGVPAASSVALLCGSFWFVPRLVSKWLGFEIAREHFNIALAAAPAILLTAAGSAVALWVSQTNDGPLRMLLNLMLCGVGFLAGAYLSLVVARRINKRMLTAASS